MAITQLKKRYHVATLSGGHPLPRMVLNNGRWN